jgi:hypothetical protein
MSQVGHIDLEDPVRAHRSTVLLGVLAAGLVLTQQACTASARQSSGPGTPAAPAAPGAPAAEKSAPAAAEKPAPATEKAGGKAPATGAGQILAGKRQIVIKPVPAAESILAVDGRGRLNLTDGEAEYGLFVLTPVGDRYQIKTAKAGPGGEPSCMGVKTNGTDSLSVEAAACDTRREGQLFTIAARKGGASPTYAISNQGAFLQVFGRTGLIAEELGDAPLKTTYAFVDNGPATLPALD